ncbi:MAG: phosphoenolpyruvate--protein phosphotransferase [Gemmatimonadales bacterium]
MSDRHVLKGIGVSPGIAVGPAVVVRWTLPDVPHRVVPRSQVEKEVRRLRAAVRDVRRHLEELQARAEDRAGVDEARIFEAQILMLEDREFLRSVEDLIRENHLTAEKAFEFKALEMRDLWAARGSAHLKERLADLTAVAIRVLRHLLHHKGEDMWGTVVQPSVVVAKEISPGLTVQLDRDRIVGLISEEGTRTSHAAILAHSIGIPAIMGLRGAVEGIAPGTTLVMDGRRGLVWLNPSAAEIEDARQRESRRRGLVREVEGGAAQPCVTADGERVWLRANVDLPDEVHVARQHGAEGVGLLRTEFLVTGRSNLPPEDEQAEYFARVARAFPGHPVVIRSFDLGGDKFPAAFSAPPEANPFLGWRAIRVCLDEPEVFRAQLRAVLRAAQHGDVQLMLPLITRLEEVERTRAMLREEAQALRRAGVAASEDVPVGVMVETPAAAVMADRIVAVSDFVSVGTNDLTQYTLVVDRGNARLADRFAPHHPAVLRLLHQTIEAARTGGKPASVCGEMASDPLGAYLLLGMGYVTLSVAPPAIPLIKWLLRQVSARAARDVAAQALRAGTADEVIGLARDGLGQHVDLQLLDADEWLPGGVRPATLNA